MRLTIPLFFAAAMLAPAQIVSFGVKAGVPLSPALPHFYDYGNNLLDTGRWTVGPTVEFRLVHGFSVEVDALYRSYRDAGSYSFPATIAEGTNLVNLVPFSGSYRQNVKVWDFPVLLKYRFTAKGVHPFVNAGYTWSHESSDEVQSLTCLGTVDACNASDLKPYLNTPIASKGSNNRSGPTVGAGLEFKYGKIKIAPELRYTRFGRPNTNNATLMVGFTF
jgi:opacity protein-like surface antigen